MDNSKWDEIDNKVKSLIIPITRNRRNKYISPTQPTHRLSKMHHRRTSNTTTGHIQRNKKRNIRQIPIYPMHTKPRRLTRAIPLQNKAKSSILKLGRSRRQLSKKHLHTIMSNPQIQMDLLSEDRDPLETLHYAITRERGQENQQRISSTHAQNPNGSGINLIQRTQQTARRSILPTPPNNNNKIPDCWKCRYNFIKGHLDNCPAKNTICNICKKIWHYAKVCRSDIPPRKLEIQNTQRNSQNYNYNRTQQPNNTQQQANTGRVRNIQQTIPENEPIQEEEETETIDPEST